MLNQLVLVGRLTSNPEKNEELRKVTLTLAAPRSFKNQDGEYETDFIDIVIFGIVGDNVIEYCRKGDLVGVKGRIQTTIIDDKKITEIIGEKVTFLSTSKQKQEEEK